MGRWFLMLLLVACCTIGCASHTIVEAVNVAPAGGYRLRNDQVEAIISPELRRVMSFRRVDGENLISSESNSHASNEKLTGWPDDISTSPGYRVISASDGRLIVESRERENTSVIVRRIYRLEGEKLIINTSMRIASNARHEQEGQHHGR